MNDNKYCSVCGIELIVEINWNISHKKNHRYICKACYNKKDEERRRKKGIQKRKWNDGRCKNCGVILNFENFKEYNKKKHFYYCNICSYEKSSMWRKNNLEKIIVSRLKHKDNNKDKLREYTRGNIISTTDNNGNPIRIKVKKRKHTLQCEICNRVVKQTSYHHWDDLNPKWGIWVCGTCHKFCEAIDNKIEPNTYLLLKEKIMIGEP